MYWKVGLSCRQCGYSRELKFMDGPGVERITELPCPNCGKPVEVQYAHMFPMTCEYCERWGYWVDQDYWCRDGIHGRYPGPCDLWRLRRVLDEQ